MPIERKPKEFAINIKTEENIEATLDNQFEAALEINNHEYVSLIVSKNNPDLQIKI